MGYGEKKGKTGEKWGILVFLYIVYCQFDERMIENESMESTFRTCELGSCRLPSYVRKSVLTATNTQ